MKRLIALTLFVFLAAAMVAAQDPPEQPPAGQGAGAPGRGGQGGGLAAQDQEPRPYDRVITREAKSKTGVFTVHQVRNSWFYEIPKSELDKDFLWVNQIARTTLGQGYGGQELANRVVRWERHGNRILLRSVNYSMVADPKDPIALAVRDANNATIIQSFPVAAWGKDDAAVIDVTRFFASDVPELSARQRLSATTMDPNRSFIEKISTFPQNVEVESTQTYVRNPPQGGGGAAPAPGPGRGGQAGAGMAIGSATLVMHYSMVKLPEKPMMPRYFDERVGYFTARQENFSKNEQRVPNRQLVTRWRLEKKDPNAALSEPVHPIVYWVDPATPAKWAPWIKKAVEDWQPAFEAAGFKNAIIAKYGPKPEEDPEWSKDDARNSVIMWLPSTTENAVGPHIHDPRTGEILNADIQVYHNVMNLARDWYFVQVGMLDPRAAKLPLSDELMGRLMEFVVAHEVGHTLGFQHNMKASSEYPAEKVHDAAWVHKMGHAPSIMDYSRFNYTAQPEDKIPAEDLMPRIGPYDVWATHWGYAPIPGAKTPEDEEKTLDAWAREQDKTPWFRFSTAGQAGSDPGDETEAVGDADAVKSTTAGLKNLERLVNMLLPATTTEPGKPYEDLTELYGRMWGQWRLEMGHVAAIVGGFDSQQKHIGQDGVRFTPVSKARQQAAVKFLNERAFPTPAWAIKPEILRRIEPIGVISQVRSAQSGVLTSLLNSARFNRLVEQEALDGAAAYSPAEFVSDVRKGIFSELDAPQVKVNAYRRNLQQAYLTAVNAKINSTATAAPAGGGGGGGGFANFAPPSDDERAMYRSELRSLSAAVSAAVAKSGDRATKAHLEAVKDEIAKILDPKFAATVPAAAANPAGRALTEDELRFLLPPDSCWPDYVVRPEP